MHEERSLVPLLCCRRTAVRDVLVQHITLRVASTITTTMKMQHCGNLASGQAPTNTESGHDLRRAVNKSRQLPHTGSMDFEAGRDATRSVRHRCRTFRSNSS